MMKNNSKGFTLIELLIVLVVIVLVPIAISTANIWFTENGVLQEIRITNPQAVEIVKAERNIYSHSVITVKNQDGTYSVYDLSSDILFRYNIHFKYKLHTEIKAPSKG